MSPFNCCSVIPMQLAVPKPKFGSIEPFRRRTVNSVQATISVFVKYIASLIHSSLD